MPMLKVKNTFISVDALEGDLEGPLPASWGGVARDFQGPAKLAAEVKLGLGMTVKLQKA